MNRQPPPPGRLDAEERALAALLPRPHGRNEPGADLDAGILAAARAATEPGRTRPVPVRRRSWIAPTAVAASLVLAVGLAWQLRPPPALDAPASADSGGVSVTGSDAMMARAIEAPPPASVAPPMRESAQMKPASPAAEPLPSAVVVGAATRQAAPAEPDMAAVAPPPAPPAPPAPVAVDSPAPASAAGGLIATPERAQAPVMAKSAARAGELARERAATDNDAAQAQEAAAMAADATTLDTVTTGDDPGEDVPPATADSPEVREAWLRRIGELLKQGKQDDAKASLAEFRRRYPDAVLPPDLRKLEH